MKVTIHATGSKGNVTQVDDVFIDAGVHIDWANMPCKTLLITHGHIDHIQAIKLALRKCERFYTPPDVKEYIEERIERWSDGQEIYELMNKKYEIPHGITPIPLKHDVPCYGYVIGEYVHLVDTTVPEAKIPTGKTLYGIESNYDEDYLISSNRTYSLKSRIKQTHMSNEEAMQLAEKLQAKYVVFLHQSQETNHPKLVRAEYEMGKYSFTPIWVEPGQIIEIEGEGNNQTYNVRGTAIRKTRNNPIDTAKRKSYDDSNALLDSRGTRNGRRDIRTTVRINGNRKRTG